MAKNDPFGELLIEALEEAVACQGFGAAVGNIICPHNLTAGGATVGLSGREGEILRRTALPCLTYAAAGSLLAFSLTLF